MKITRRQLRKIIREMVLREQEDRADRFTLSLKVEYSPEGNEQLVLHVKESGMVYDLFDYTDATKQKGGLYGLERQFELDHGVLPPDGAMVIDYDGVGMGDLPIEEAFEWVKAEFEAQHGDGKILERRMETDVMKIVSRAIAQGPKTHQELLANVLDEFPNTSDEEIDGHIDSLEDSGQIIFDRTIQKYK